MQNTLVSNHNHVCIQKLRLFTKIQNNVLRKEVKNKYDVINDIWRLSAYIIILFIYNLQGYNTSEIFVILLQRVIINDEKKKKTKRYTFKVLNKICFYIKLEITENHVLHEFYCDLEQYSTKHDLIASIIGTCYIAVYCFRLFVH